MPNMNSLSNLGDEYTRQIFKRLSHGRHLLELPVYYPALQGPFGKGVFFKMKTDALEEIYSFFLG